VCFFFFSSPLFFFHFFLVFFPPSTGLPAVWSATDFSEWSQCNNSCGPGQQQRTALCDLRCHGTCDGPAPVFTRNCFGGLPAAWDGPYTDWSPSPCNASCGESLQSRSRTCDNHCTRNGSCVGVAPVETRVCRAGAPAAWSAFGPWQPCNVLCGEGTESRVQTCESNCYGTCAGPIPKETRVCRVGM
jgi:hypothetical protein